MFVICAGMYRSGSTWQYQVACDLLERSGGCDRLDFLTGPEFAAVADAPEPSAGRWRALKTHDGHPAFAAALAAGRAVCLYSFRDMRDVALSLAHKFAQPVEVVVGTDKWLRVCQDSHAFWTAQPHRFDQRYEAWMADPVAAVRGIAARLGVALAPGEAEDVARRFDLASNKDRAASFAAQLQAAGTDLSDPKNARIGDPATLLHWNHIRAGAVGGWRTTATPDECRLIARECDGWLSDHGYGDPAWTALGDAARRLDVAEDRVRELTIALASQRAGALVRLAEKDAEITELRTLAHVLHTTLNVGWSTFPYRAVRAVRRLFTRRMAPAVTASPA